MYLKYFGFREQPFGVTPDPRFLYLSAAHREALASLYYGIESNRGFLGLIAKPGMGKTTILFHLLEKFRSSARTAFLFQTQCNSREFMRFLLGELGYEGDSHDFVRMHEEFNRRLIREAQAGHRFIVVIDEAQNLEPSVLETVRLLSDFETPQAKLMHIVLAGQPELADKLASPGLAQLRQRVSILHGLEPLPSWEIKNYIEHRLRVAGYEGESLFTPDVYDEIASFTEGIPRNVNNFCFNSLSLACALRKKAVDLAVAREVMADLDINRLVSGRGPEDGRLPDSKAQQALAFAKSAESRAHSNGNGNNGTEALSPEQARAYMQQLALKLKTWQESLEKTLNGMQTTTPRRNPQDPD
jgi:general secretion pathway protein A